MKENIKITLFLTTLFLFPILMEYHSGSYSLFFRSKQDTKGCIEQGEDGYLVHISVNKQDYTQTFSSFNIGFPSIDLQEGDSVLVTYDITNPKHFYLSSKYTSLLLIMEMIGVTIFGIALPVCLRMMLISLYNEIRYWFIE